MGDFTFKKSLTGMSPQLMDATTSAAIEDGDLLVFSVSTGYVSKATDGVKPNFLAGVAMGAAASGGLVSYIPITDLDIYECQSSGTQPKRGEMVELNVTTAGVTTVVTSSAKTGVATNLGIGRVEKVIDSDTVWIRFMGLAGNASTT